MTQAKFQCQSSHNLSTYMCNNPYMNIFQLYSNFEASKQIVTLWGCLCEQTILQCFLPICTMCLDQTFQFFFFSIQTFHFFVFSIQTFQFSIFSIQTFHFFVFSIQTFQFSDFNFQYSHIQIQTFQFSKPQIPNASHRDFNFQNFKFQMLHIEISIFNFSYYFVIYPCQFGFHLQVTCHLGSRFGWILSKVQFQSCIT